MKNTRKYNYVIIYLIAFLVLFGVFSSLSLNVAEAADEKYAFDTTYVFDDLKNATIDGFPFNVNSYPANKKGDLQILTFVEFGAAYRVNERQKYSLYLYIYNPQQLDLSTVVGQNKVQVAVGYNKDNTPDEYEKFNLIYCSKSVGDFSNLFYKFRIEDKTSGSDNKTLKQRAFDNVNYFSGRRYDVSGMELIVDGNQVAVEYTVGGSYVFYGYAAGLGEDKTSDSTLSCHVTDLDTLKLKVEHTSYRSPGISSVGDFHQNEVDSVWFSVPNKILDLYGNLQKIAAEWWEYKTKVALITCSEEVNQKFEPFTKVKFNQGYVENAVTVLGNPKSNTVIGQGKNSISALYGMNVDYDNNWSWYSINKEIDMIPYLFKVPKISSKDIFNFLKSNGTNAGIAEANKVAQYIYNYTNDLGNGYIDCNNRKISVDLFEDYVDPGRTYGYNNVLIDLADTFDLKSWDDVHTMHSWIAKLFIFGFKQPETGGGISNEPQIKKVTANDLVGSLDTISERLLINSEDVNLLKNRYLECTSKLEKETLFLFRFANVDYMSMPATVGGYRWSSGSDDSYIAQQTVFLDFDIISLTFSKEGVETVIPVVSSPQDFINSFTPPVDRGVPEWLQILINVLIGIAIVIGIIIVIWILKLIWPIITFPFKLISSAVKSSKKKEKK